MKSNHLHIQFLGAIILGLVFIKLQMIEWIFGSTLYGVFLIYKIVSSMTLIEFETSNSYDYIVREEENSYLKYLSGGICLYLCSLAIWTDLLGLFDEGQIVEIRAFYGIFLLLGLVTLFGKTKPKRIKIFNVESDDNSESVSDKDLVFLNKYAEKNDFKKFVFNKQEIDFVTSVVAQIIAVVIVLLCTLSLFGFGALGVFEDNDVEGMVVNIGLLSVGGIVSYIIIPVFYGSIQPDACRFHLNTETSFLKIPFDVGIKVDNNQRTFHFGEIHKVEFATTKEYVSNSRNDSPSYDKYIFTINLILDDSKKAIYYNSSNKIQDHDIKKFVFLVAKQVAILTKSELVISNNIIDK